MASQIHAEGYEIKIDEEGNEWFCTAGTQQKTVYHSDIRHDLQHYSEWSIPHGGPKYKSMLGAGTDDRTSYDHFYDFCGTTKADRPNCLYCLKPPRTTHKDKATTFLVWNGRVVLNYRGRPIRALGLPLTISSKIGDEEARLEAMLRSDSNIGWPDILARILRRGETSDKAKKVRNALNMRVVRFRVVARLTSRDATLGSPALEAYLSSILTAEMIVKNTTYSVPDLAKGSCEKDYIELLNAGIQTGEGHAQNNNNSSRKKKSMTKVVLSQETKLEQKKAAEERIRRAKNKLIRAENWAQTIADREAQNPIPDPSINGPVKCDAIESIVAFKLASLHQYRLDGSVAIEAWYTLPHAAPTFPFDNARMENFFGSKAYLQDPAFLRPDSNDPYGILGSPTVTAVQACIVDFLLEPARMQYRRAILVENGIGGYQPIFTTNPSESYWKQLQMLQSAFEEQWVEVGFTGNAPVLCGLLKLDYDTLAWNTNDVPHLILVWQTIDSCNRTLAIQQRQEANCQRQRLIQLRRDLDDEEKAIAKDSDDEEQDELSIEVKEGDNLDDVEMEEGREAKEDLMKVKSSKEDHQKD